MSIRGELYTSGQEVQKGAAGISVEGLMALPISPSIRNINSQQTWSQRSFLDSHSCSDEKDGQLNSYNMLAHNFGGSEIQGHVSMFSSSGGLDAVSPPYGEVEKVARGCKKKTFMQKRSRGEPGLLATVHSHN